MNDSSKPVVAFDFDKSLAFHEADHPADWTGEPILPMVVTLFSCLGAGYDVVIHTARVNPENPDASIAEAAIKAWCVKYLGREFPVTCMKSRRMIAFFDDKAIAVIPNTGYRVDGRDGEVPSCE